MAAFPVSSALITVLLVVLELLGFFQLLSSICTVSKCFTSFAFLPLPYFSCIYIYTSFGTITFITFIRIHTSVPVSRCESLLGSHPSCLRVLYLPFPITFAVVIGVSQEEQSFEISTPRCVYWSTIGKSSPPHLLPTEIYRVHLIFVSNNY